MNTVVPATHIVCPLCLARPGQPCEETRDGSTTALAEPHTIRVRAAQEYAQ